MKLLCISDQIDPLIYSAGVKDRYGDVDAVLCAGDLPMEYIDFIVTTLNKPTYFIFGNHNLDDYRFYHATPENGGYIADPELNHCHGAVYAGFKTVRAGNLIITGLSGSLRYNKGLSQYTDRQMSRQILKLSFRLFLNRLMYGRATDILLTHSPPEGIHDKNDPCHKGFKCFLKFMEKYSPKYLVHGHIHLYDIHEPRVTQYKNTTVINAFGHYLIEMPDPVKKEKHSK